MHFFKNSLIFQLDEPFTHTQKSLTEAFARLPLLGCAGEELIAYGWLPAFTSSPTFLEPAIHRPEEKGGREISNPYLVEEITHAFFIRLGVEQKRLPRLAIKTALEKRAQDQSIDLSDRRRYKELEALVIKELIKTIPPERTSIQAYIDTQKNWLVIDASSPKKGALLTTFLRKTLGSLPITPYAPQTTLPSLFSHWVLHGIPNPEFSFLDEIELKELKKEEGGTAKFKGIPPHSPEILKNLEHDWEATKLALLYKESIHFILGEDFILKRLKYEPLFFDALGAIEEDFNDSYYQAQSNATLQVAEFRELFTSLYQLCYL